MESYIAKSKYRTLLWTQLMIGLICAIVGAIFGAYANHLIQAGNRLRPLMVLDSTISSQNGDKKPHVFVRYTLEPSQYYYRENLLQSRDKFTLAELVMKIGNEGTRNASDVYLQIVMPGGSTLFDMRGEPSIEFRTSNGSFEKLGSDSVRFEGKSSVLFRVSNLPVDLAKSLTVRFKRDTLQYPQLGPVEILVFDDERLLFSFDASKSK